MEIHATASKPHGELLQTPIWRMEGRSTQASADYLSISGGRISKLEQHEAVIVGDNFAAQ